jgi:hypothetical protein
MSSINAVGEDHGTSWELTYDSQGEGGGDRWERGGETLKCTQDMQNTVYIVRRGFANRAASYTRLTPLFIC